MADRLTRRERAAMRLALEVLRFDVRYRGSPRCALEAETDVHEAVAALRFGGVDEGVSAAVRTVNCDALTAALVRARLALYLRARLRADRGDFGRWWVVDAPGEDEPLMYARHGDAEITAGLTGGTVHRAVPLWEQAPAHEEDR